MCTSFTIVVMNSSEYFDGLCHISDSKHCWCRHFSKSVCTSSAKHVSDTTSTSTAIDDEGLQTLHCGQSIVFFITPRARKSYRTIRAPCLQSNTYPSHAFVVIFGKISVNAFAHDSFETAYSGDTHDGMDITNAS